jgi:hypothetical protein
MLKSLKPIYRPFMRVVGDILVLNEMEALVVRGVLERGSLRSYPPWIAPNTAYNTYMPSHTKVLLSSAAFR